MNQQSSPHILVKVQCGVQHEPMPKWKRKPLNKRRAKMVTGALSTFICQTASKHLLDKGHRVYQWTAIGTPRHGYDGTCTDCGQPFRAKPRITKRLPFPQLLTTSDAAYCPAAMEKAREMAAAEQLEQAA